MISVTLIADAQQGANPALELLKTNPLLVVRHLQSTQQVRDHLFNLPTDVLILRFPEAPTAPVSRVQRLRSLGIQSWIIILAPQIETAIRYSLLREAKVLVIDESTELGDLATLIRSVYSNPDFNYRARRAHSRYERTDPLRLLGQEGIIWSGNFCDCAHQGAQVLLAGPRIPKKSRVTLEYQSRQRDQIHRIESIVTWTMSAGPTLRLSDPKNERQQYAGLQFLAIVS